MHAVIEYVNKAHEIEVYKRNATSVFPVKLEKCESVDFDQMIKKYMYDNLYNSATNNFIVSDCNLEKSVEYDIIINTYDGKYDNKKIINNYYKCNVYHKD